jgi:hypothetical protein
MGSYARVLHVSTETGSDQAGDGSAAKPWKSIQHAVSMIEDAAADRKFAIFAAAGDYSGDTLKMKEYVDIYGGFSSQWERDILAFRTTLDGEGERRVVIGADHARLDGFEIRDGRIRGTGAAILCQGVSPHLTNNWFVGNQTLGPQPWNPKLIHETANDGGAVYCSEGASPDIQNNLFSGNLTENGRGAAIAMDRKCGGRIANNVFFRNTTGLKDPMRSSDGGAVSIFRWSNPVVENNLFLSNRADSKNDGGGLFVALWSAPRIEDNVFVDNWASDDAGGLFVGGQEHRYDQPLDPLPPADRFFVSIKNNVFVGNRNTSRNSGAMRMTMESRGEFISNVVVNNQGIYFQRSEVAVMDNVILDDFRFIETKEGLKPGRITRNLIWGDFELSTEAPVSFCNMRDAYPGDGNISSPPTFVPDRIELFADVVKFDRKQHFSTVFTSEAGYAAGELVGRIVRAGGKWGVVKSNRATSIEVWGEISGETHLTVLPTYSLINDTAK